LIPYIGDFAVNSTLRYFYGSNAAGGASVARTTAGAYRVYKNISTTERTSIAGISDFSGFDSVTGLNAVTIDLSNNTDAGFYAAGNDYVVVLVGAVVDSLTVNVPLFQFSIENRAATLLVRNAIADSVWDEAYSAHTTAGTFGKLMDTLRKSNYVTEGTVTSAVTATTTIFSTNLTNEDGSLDHQSLLFLTGDHIGTSIPILNYSLSNGLVQLEEPLHAPPTTGNEFVILPQHVHSIIGIAAGVWNELSTSYNTANTFGKILKDLRLSTFVTSGLVTSTISPTPDVFSTNLVALDDTYDHQTIVFVTGDLAGESKPINVFLQSGGQVFVEEAFTVIPQVGDEFYILPMHVHSIEAIADGLLNRLLDSSGNSADVFNERTVRSALRAMRNKVMVNNGTIAVYKEDDAVAAWEGTLSNTANVTVNPDGGS
jgi:hypothetical protein